MSRPTLHVVVPGPLDQRTGGYRYDARMVDGARRQGWRVHVHSLEGSFPDPDPAARTSLESTLAGLPAGARVLIDGLALGGLPEPAVAQRDRLDLLALIHHPLADETGLSAEVRDRFARSEEAALAACKGVITTSAFTASRIAAYGVPVGRIRPVPPGTDPAPPAAGPGPGAPPQLLSVGALVPRKGQDVLVSALERIGDTPWSCVFAGSLCRDSGFAEKVAESVRDAGLGQRIRLVGECDEEALDDLYHRASVFVLPSHYEGYGMAFTEALARGLPVVGTTGGAVPQTVPEKAGVLVPPGDPDALAEALVGLLGPSGSRTRAAMSAGALAWARTAPDWADAAACFTRAVLELTPDEGAEGA